MAGTNNFQVFGSSNMNMMSDADYIASTERVSGVQSGTIANPLLANKIWYQTSIMAAAIAQFIANQGINVDDTNLNNLVTTITKSIVSGSGSPYADRVAHGLFAGADIGDMDFCQPQNAPLSAIYSTSSAGNLLGGYHYREVLISGYVNSDGTYFVRGFSPAVSRSSYDVSPSSQKVSITNLPVGSASCIGRAIYRSSANGATGSEKFCGVIWDNVTTTYTDNMVDSQLGTGMPTVQGAAIPANVPISNTTGTSMSASRITGLPTKLPDPNVLTVLQGYGGQAGSYDGSSPMTVSVPHVTLNTASPTTMLADGELYGVY